MKLIIRMISFLLVFTGIYFGMHFFAISQFAKSFGSVMTIPLYLLIVALTLFGPISMILIRVIRNKFTIYTYWLGSILMGSIFTSFAMMLVYFVLSKFMALPDYIGYIFLAALIVVTGVSMFNANSIMIKEQNFKIKGFKKQKFVHLSDIHVGTLHNGKFLKSIVRKVNPIKPDAIFITGDLVDGAGPLDKSYKYLDDFKAPIFFCLGNHEKYEDLDRVMELLSQTKMNILRNQSTEFNGYQIIGVDDYEQASKAIEQLKKFEYKKATIVLNHRPTGFEYLAKQPAKVLQLSGHTHNGQIIPFNFIVKIAFKYIKGLYELNGSYIHTSPGTGTWGPPMRSGSRSEISVLNIN